MTGFQHPILLMVISTEADIGAVEALAATMIVPQPSIPEDSEAGLTVLPFQTLIKGMSMASVQLTGHTQPEPILTIVGQGFNALDFGPVGAIQAFTKFIRERFKGLQLSELQIENLPTDCYVKFRVTPRTLMGLMTLQETPKPLPKVNAPSTATLH